MFEGWKDKLKRNRQPKPEPQAIFADPNTLTGDAAELYAEVVNCLKLLNTTKQEDIVGVRDDLAFYLGKILSSPEVIQQLVNIDLFSDANIAQVEDFLRCLPRDTHFAGYGERAAEDMKPLQVVDRIKSLAWSTESVDEQGIPDEFGIKKWLLNTQKKNSLRPTESDVANEQLESAEESVVNVDRRPKYREFKSQMLQIIDKIDSVDSATEVRSLTDELRNLNTLKDRANRDGALSVEENIEFMKALFKLPIFENKKSFTVLAFLHSLPQLQPIGANDNLRAIEIISRVEALVEKPLNRDTIEAKIPFLDNERIEEDKQINARNNTNSIIETTVDDAMKVLQTGDRKAVRILLANKPFAIDNVGNLRWWLADEIIKNRQN